MLFFDELVELYTFRETLLSLLRGNDSLTQSEI